MKRALLCLLGAFACAVAVAPRAFFPWHLSGDDFVVQVSGQHGVTKWDQSPDAAYKQRYAEGYQAGVVDATQGRLWCAPTDMKPDEVDDRIWAAMRSRRGSMPGNAADELIRLYVERFPCPPRSQP